MKAAMKTTVLLVVLSTTTCILWGKGFVPPLPSFSSTSAHLCTTSNEDAMETLQTEYKDLQTLLIQDLQLRKMDEAKDVSQEMFEKAAAMNALKRYDQEEKLAQANEHLQHAIGDLEQAQALQDEARGDAEWSQDEVAMVESLDAGYEDLERLRDLSVTHAARQLEEDARDLVLESTFQELKAEADQDDAAALLRKLEQNEAALKATIQQLREEKTAALKKDWETHHLPKHQDFVKTVYKILKRTKLIDHDPTKGNVAF